MIQKLVQILSVNHLNDLFIILNTDFNLDFFTQTYDNCWYFCDQSELFSCKKHLVWIIIPSGKQSSEKWIESICTLNTQF